MASSRGPMDTKRLVNGNTIRGNSNHKRPKWEHQPSAKCRIRSSRKSLPYCLCSRRATICLLNRRRLRQARFRRLLRRESAEVEIHNEEDLEKQLLQAYELENPTNWPSSDHELVVRLRQLADKWLCPPNLKAKITAGWVANWRRKFGVGKDTDRKTEDESSAPKVGVVIDGQKEEVAVKVEMVECSQSNADLEQILSGYQEDEVYICFCFEFCWSSLPDRQLGARGGGAGGLEGRVSSASGSEGGAEENSVFVLMAANRSGRHRTRLCVVGKEWRPACLRHVNMLSQPVVYAGGGDGHITSDLFAWWFYHEFSPGALTINRKVALLAEAKPYLPCQEFVSSDARAQLLLVPGAGERTAEGGEAAAQALNIIETELRVRYAKLLLTSVFFEDRAVSVHSYVAQFTLREAFPLLHKAWLTIRIESFARHYRMAVAGAIDGSVTDVFNEPDDGRLLLELQWMSHDLGLKITDDDLLKWAYSGFVSASFADGATLQGRKLKVEPTDGEEEVPTASDAVTHLSKALAWMETEPLDPNYLLFIGEIVLMAKQARDLCLWFSGP